jgi:hypothetical protein
MAGKRYWQSIGLCGLTLFSLSALAQGSAPKWGPHIDVEAKPGSKRSLGEADLFLPLSQDARSLLFANLRARFDNHDSREGNFGLGWRQMRDSGWNLGLYGYFDRRRSPDTGYHYNQATLGAEALGRDWEFRANGYVPVGTKARDLGTTSTASLSGASIQVTSTNREERALKGFDAEVGWRAPMFDSEARRQLRLYLGGYRFSDGGVTVEGPRARAELAMDDLNWFGRGTSLFLGLETQNDGVRGHQNFLSLRLRIPLGKERGAARPLNAQERRMTAPVMRDVDIVTRSHVASTLVENATATAGGQTITVLNSATTAGNNLATAVAAAPGGSTILLSGTFNVTGGNTVVVDGGRTLRSGATTVRTASGHEAVLTTSATIAGTNVTGSTVQLVNNATLAGVTVSNAYSGSGGAAVLLAGGAGNITLLNNTITVTQSGNNAAGALTFGGNNANVLVNGNTITATGSGPATTMTVLGMNSVSIAATITGNTLSASGGINNNYIVWWLANQTTLNAGSTGNVRGSGACNGTPANGSISFTNGTTCPP